MDPIEQNRTSCCNKTTDLDPCSKFVKTIIWKIFIHVCRINMHAYVVQGPEMDSVKLCSVEC
jgi:hypothetical protein